MSEKSEAREAAAHERAHEKEVEAHKYKHKATMPLLGSSVWYYYVNEKDEEGNLTAATAIVSKVSDHDDTVNLAVLEHSGMWVNATHVPVMTANSKPEELAPLEDYCVIPK